MREAFAGLGERIYLNTASMAVGCDAAAAALRDAAMACGRGEFDYLPPEEAGEECRRLFTSLIGARVEDQLAGAAND